MNGIFDTAVNAFRVESIRKRLLYTFMILGIFMLGGLVPVPGMDGEKFTALINQWGQLGSIMDIISGGGLAHASILSMGVSPYINASIIIQLLCIAIPALERMAKDEGEEGKKKINNITRYTVDRGAPEREAPQHEAPGREQPHSSPAQLFLWRP